MFLNTAAVLKNFEQFAGKNLMMESCFILIYFSPMFHDVSGGIEMKYWAKMG